uniref:Probable oligoribonuclease n=1 Tax=Drosophila rhopaloa TaxID=1041015 RepID=A0A6P4E6Z5_DRORH
MSTDIVWIDMDNSGSDPETDLILNFACFITDKDGNIKSVGPYFAINHPEEKFYKSGSFQMSVARELGVLDRCRNSSVKPEQAEDLMLNYLKNNVPRKACPIAGPFIHIDRVFIKKHMPSVDDYLNHDFVHLINFPNASLAMILFFNEKC